MTKYNKIILKAWLARGNETSLFYLDGFLELKSPVYSNCEMFSLSLGLFETNSKTIRITSVLNKQRFVRPQNETTLLSSV